MVADRAAPATRLRLVTEEQGSSVRPSRPEPARDDAELLAAVRDGDATAATSLHDRIRPAIERTVGRLLGHVDADADDMVQLALIGVVDGIDRFRGECSLDSWASMVAARVVYKHLRRRKLERRIFATEPRDEPRDPARLAPAARDLLHRVNEHLRGIDDSKAWTFVLHDVCGYDLREVAAITEVSVTAAQSRLVRGRRELHNRLAADPELARWLEEGEETP